MFNPLTPRQYGNEVPAVGQVALVQVFDIITWGPKNNVLFYHDIRLRDIMHTPSFDFLYEPGS